jgi:hypothetical protein
MFDAQAEESASSKDDSADGEGEPESDTIKSVTILERYHDTKVVVCTHCMDVNKAAVFIHQPRNGFHCSTCKSKIRRAPLLKLLTNSCLRSRRKGE